MDEVLPLCFSATLTWQLGRRESQVPFVQEASSPARRQLVEGSVAASLELLELAEVLRFRPPDRRRGRGITINIITIIIISIITIINFITLRY